MSEFTLKSKKIPLYDEYEVIVAGGGPAGCSAAISASREGAKVLLIEFSGALGGMATGGMVPAWCPYSDGEKIIYRGISQEVFERLKSQMPHVDKNRLDWVPIDSEKLKRIYDDMVTESGVTVLFFSLICDVEKDDYGNISEVIVSNKAGLSAYKAKVFIDATGDADLACYAKAPFEIGNDNDREVQPGSLCFKMTNVDEYAYVNSPDIFPSNNPQSPYADIIAQGKYKRLTDNHLCQNLISSRTVGFNAGHLYNVFHDKPESITFAMMEGRKIAEDIKNALTECRPDAFASATVSQTADLMGIRESRRIIGDYIITIEDYLARRSFPDEICRCCYYIDMHESKSEKKKIEEGTLLPVEKRSHHYSKGESYGVPYRALIPRNVNNLLVVGRSISCDRHVQASVRIMPACMTTGEAGGIAGYLALKHNGNVRKIDVEELRNILKQRGAYIK